MSTTLRSRPPRACVCAAAARMTARVPSTAGLISSASGSLVSMTKGLRCWWIPKVWRLVECGVGVGWVGKETFAVSHTTMCTCMQTYSSLCCACSRP